MSRTFIDRALDGEILGFDLTEAADDAVDAWHESDTSIALHEWLGMTEDEYEAFVMSPESLRYILQARQSGRLLADVLQDAYRPEGELLMAARSSVQVSQEDLRRWLVQTGRGNQ